jgi:hypothetical protein
MSPSASHAAANSATGPTPANEFLECVDTWAAKQDDVPGRSEAIRRLVEIGLKAKQ